MGGGAASIEGGGSAASIEGADAPYGRKVRQPLKGCALTKIGSANTSIPSPFLTKNEPPMRGSYTLPEFIPKNPSSPIWRNENESLFYPKRSEAIK